MAPPRDDMPKGRVRRAAKVGRLAGGTTARAYATNAAKPPPHEGRRRRAAKAGRRAGGTTARAYATKAANLTRDDEGRRAAAERRQMAAAEQIFDVLGQMKGAAMTGGQGAPLTAHG